MSDTPSSTPAANSSKFVATSVDHPRLTEADASSIRVFLRAYDQYATELKERSRQVLSEDSLSTEVVKPVNLKFCVDAEWLESTVGNRFLSIDPFACRIR